MKDAVVKQNSEYVACENLDDLTFRPIVGGPAAPTQRLSNLLDIIIKPLFHNVYSFVRDDLDFLRHLPDHVESNTTLVTLDVVNLYTYITARLEQEALCYWIEKYRNNIDERFTTQFLTEATDLALKNNIVMFNITFRRKKDGRRRVGKNITVMVY